MSSPTRDGGSLRIFLNLPATIRLLVIGTAVNYSGAMIGPLLSIVLVRGFQLTPSDASWIVGSFAAGGFIAVLCGGYLTDHWGRKPTLLLSMFGAGVTGVVLALLQDLIFFQFMLVAFGFFSELYRPASTAIITDTLRSDARPLGIAANRVAINLGGFVAMLLGGWLLDVNWKWMLWLDAVTCLAFGMIAWRGIPDDRRHTAARRRPTEGAAHLTSIPPWRNGTFVRIFAAMAVICFVYASHFSVLPLTMAREGKLDNTWIGFILGINGVLIVWLELVWIERLRRFGPLKVSALGCLWIGLGLGLTGVSAHWAWYVFTLLLWTIGEILTFSFLIAYAADVAPEDRRGQYLSLISLTWRGALAINPLIAMPLYEHMAVRGFWGLHLLLATLAAVLVWRLERPRAVTARSTT
jgi:MFS family permease